MDEPEAAALAAIKDIWMTGGAAHASAPAKWRSLLGEGGVGERELRLLAIAGQAVQIGFRPAAAAGLKPHPELPLPALPVLPERLRPAFRQLLAAAASREAGGLILKLMAARGWLAHPADFMPGTDTTLLPVIYEPLRAWVGADDAPETHDEPLTADSWELFPPSERCRKLQAMRAADPARARALLAEKAAAEPAEKRLDLVGVLKTGLCADDTDYLNSLLADRSGKIKTLAQQLLGRLGAAGTGEADAELAEWFTRGSSGLLGRQPTLQPKQLHKNVQTRRRLELMEAASLAGFAGLFGLSREQLIAAWKFDFDRDTDIALAGMIERTASDAEVTAFHRRLLTTDRPDAALFAPLAGRLDDSQRRDSIRTLIRAGAGETPLSATYFDAEVGFMTYDELAAVPLYRDVREQIRLQDETAESFMRRIRKLLPTGFDFLLPVEKTRLLDDLKRRHAGKPPYAIEAMFTNLGLIADRDAAVRLIETFTAEGLSPLDPRLALLRFNAALVDAPPANEEPN